ncbi:MAG: hypothetical protein K0S28_1285 [Paucimonas sp.]|jgi:hypothetical protein|nr:hypothetical protein [Paucimonas sp.]
MSNEIDFAFKLRHALNENLNHLPDDTGERLAAARRVALARKKADVPMRAVVTERNLAGHVGSFLSEPVSWVVRMGLALPLIVCTLGLVGLYHYEEQQRIEEAADLDAEVLVDELPISAYLDHGFNAYLLKRDE